MTLMVITLAAILGIALLYWFPVRRWYRRSEAQRLNPNRAMSGDAEILAPDYDATLAITADASPSAVWEALLNFGWPAEGRRSYEWLGRAFGFLDPRERMVAGHAGSLERPLSIAVGSHSQIHVKTIDPGRTLVLGRTAHGGSWAWQFELSTLAEGRTRVILRDRAQVRATAAARVLLPIRKAVSFGLTRKMLLDIKRASEAASKPDTATRIS